jgi:hypothetical protein
MGDRHEADIAEWIGGVQQKASGSQWQSQMDAVNGEKSTPFPLAADGKSTMKGSISVTLEMWKKAVEQTFGKIPTVWLRWYRDENLREVELDLVVIGRREFVEILDAARNWELFQEVQQNILTVVDGQHLAEVVQEPSSGCSCCR